MTRSCARPFPTATGYNRSPGRNCSARGPIGNASISPELQEIVYRALERDPKNRYATAREFAWDLEHQDQVGVGDRPELADWKQRRTPWLRRTSFYLLLALIPIVIFGLLLYVARRG